MRVINPGSVGCVALQGPRPLVEELAGALARAGLWGPVSWDGPGGSAVPGVPGAAPGKAAGAEEAAGARPWPAVVTLPTDAPERADELLDAVARSLRVRIRPPSPAAAPRRPPVRSPQKP